MIEYTFLAEQATALEMWAGLNALGAEGWQMCGQGNGGYYFMRHKPIVIGSAMSPTDEQRQ